MPRQTQEEWYREQEDGNVAKDAESYNGILRVKEVQTRAWKFRMERLRDLCMM
jgi:hypothetical protein